MTRPSLRTSLHLIFNLVTLLLAASALIYVHRANALAQPVADAPTATSTTTFPYEGRLGDANGDPVTGTYDMTFNLYNVNTDGTPLWTEAWTGANAVQVNEGLFSVLLGNLTPLPENVIVENTSLWLGVTIGTDSEMTPRVQLGSVPYAVSALNVPEHQPYVPLYRPQTLDLTEVDASLKGFVGGFTDGKFGYFVPYNNGGFFGKVVRVDLQNFTSGGVQVLDLTTIDTALKGFKGGFTDGHYGYFVPYANGTAAYFGKVVRVDLQNFTISGVTILDLTTTDVDLRGFMGGFTDGQYGYFVPNYNGTSGKIARVDLQNFTTGGISVLDLTTVSNELKGFIGGFTDGRYSYFVPYDNGVRFGKLVRVDLQNFTIDGVSILDLATIDPVLKGFVGGFSDGRYSYFIPNRTDNDVRFGKVVRVDSQNFTESGTTILDLTILDNSLKGYQGGFIIGHYGYLVPYNNGATFGKVVRIDLDNYTLGGVKVIDMTTVDSDLHGFIGGFSDGNFGYFVPNFNGDQFGKIARIQLFFGGGSP